MISAVGKYDYNHFSKLHVMIRIMVITSLLYHLCRNFKKPAYYLWLRHPIE